MSPYRRGRGQAFDIVVCGRSAAVGRRGQRLLLVVVVGA